MRASVVCALVAGFLAAPASACLCADQRPRDKLAAAQSAFIGGVVGKRLVAPRRGIYRYRIRVQRSFKRQFGPRLRVRATSFSASCGFEWAVGDRVAAYLYGRRGAWQTNVCLLERPKRLARAARKLARATGEVPSDPSVEPSSPPCGA